MPKKKITSAKLRQPNGHFSQATSIEAQGRLVFLSGMTSRRADGSIAGVGNIEEQTRQVCENLKAAVEEAGGTLDDICRVDVYVRNMEHFDTIHKVRREYFTGIAPASTMVEICKMTSPDYLIEINAIAVVANSTGRRDQVLPVRRCGLSQKIRCLKPASRSASCECGCGNPIGNGQSDPNTTRSSPKTCAASCKASLSCAMQSTQNRRSASRGASIDVSRPARAVA